ncbi:MULTISPECIES: transposase [unclassified Janthinobacterium]|uniref:transposase n=1 Tax=unclassified Janthinobacterium TaxID=2610881 RepID=UPI000688DB64|nr:MULTISPECIES: transposase [unclassified Janthinobacterium]MEC5164192.1 transposase-like protein [Janthinobacterium sp. CG_S6]
MDTIIQPVITRAKRGPYRHHSDEFKRAAVARTLVADASVSLIARELKINANQLFSWRKRFGGEGLRAATHRANWWLSRCSILRARLRPHRRVVSHPA